MNITRENINDLNALLTIKVEKSDYAENIEKVLKDYRKKAQMPGFRPGKVPMGVVKKMYGKAALVEEVNKLVSESISKYILEEKLNVLGEPMPKEEETKEIDWDNQEDFEFSFEMGLSPEFELKLTKREKYPWYDIQVDEKMIGDYTSMFKRRYGSMQPADEVVEDTSFKAVLTEMDNDGNIKEAGIFVQDGVVAYNFVKDEDTQKILKGSKEGDILTIDVKKAFTNEADLASLLKIEKEKLSEIGSNFQVTVKEITRFSEAEMNQEFFDKVYGEGNVKSEEEFIEKISADIKVNLEKESEYKFMLDAKDKLVNKLKLPLPDEFLKKWLTFINREKFTAEDIEKDYDKFGKDLQWQIIKDKIIKENELKVEDKEVIELAKELTRSQFAQYGLANIPEENVEGYAMEMLKNEEQRRNLYDRKYEERIAAFIKENVKIDIKEITSEEFNKLFEKK